MMDWGYMSGYMGAGFGTMTAVALLCLLVVAGAVLVVADLLGHTDLLGHNRGEDAPPPWQRRSPAETELELRYARGEIDAATFAQQQSVLRHG